MTNLDTLIERVKALTGPDREVDALLHAHFEGRTVREQIHPEFGRQLLARNSRPPHDEYWLDHPASVYPALTSSIDAAIALCERVLPDTGPNMVYSFNLDWHASAHSHMSYSAEFFVAEGDPPDMTSYQGQAPTLPLAIILALLLALKAQEPSHD